MNENQESDGLNIHAQGGSLAFEKLRIVFEEIRSKDPRLRDFLELTMEGQAWVSHALMSATADFTHLVDVAQLLSKDDDRHPSQSNRKGHHCFDTQRSKYRMLRRINLSLSVDLELLDDPSSPQNEDAATDVIDVSSQPDEYSDTPCIGRLSWIYDGHGAFSLLFFVSIERGHNHNIHTDEMDGNTIRCALLFGDIVFQEVILQCSSTFDAFEFRDIIEASPIIIDAIDEDEEFRLIFGSTKGDLKLYNDDINPLIARNRTVSDNRAPECPLMIVLTSHGTLEIAHADSGCPRVYLIFPSENDKEHGNGSEDGNTTETKKSGIASPIPSTRKLKDQTLSDVTSDSLFYERQSDANQSHLAISCQDRLHSRCYVVIASQNEESVGILRIYDVTDPSMSNDGITGPLRSDKMLLNPVELPIPIEQIIECQLTASGFITLIALVRRDHGASDSNKLNTNEGFILLWRYPIDRAIKCNPEWEIHSILESLH